MVQGLGSGFTAFLNNVTSFSPWSMGVMSTGVETTLQMPGSRNIYPIPASGTLNIAGGFVANSQLNIELIDMTGRMVKVLYNGKSPVNDGGNGEPAIAANIAGIKPGIYICRITENTNITASKIIIE